MKKLLLLVAIFFLWRCDDIPSEVVESPKADYNISAITVPDSVVFSSTSASIVFSVQVENKQNINKLTFEIKSEDGLIVMVSNKEMRDNGDLEGMAMF